MATYAIYLTVPHYNDFDAVVGVSYSPTGRRYFSEALAHKIASRLSAQGGYDDNDFVVIRDGDKAVRPLWPRYDRPVNLDDCPF